LAITARKKILAPPASARIGMPLGPDLTVCTGSLSLDSLRIRSLR
jgi:hypothetical protein